MEHKSRRPELDYLRARVQNPYSNFKTELNTMDEIKFLQAMIEDLENHLIIIKRRMIKLDGARQVAETSTSD